jgi:hypothetical protein
LFYRWLRDLHLYFGLFISPFILLFAASVFFINHAKVATDRVTSVETFHDLNIPEDIESARGPAAIVGAKQILQQVRGTGEIGFTRFVAKSRHFIFPVSKPGLEMTVDVNLDARSAAVSRRETSVWEGLGYLHKMPGPHNVAIRGNWIATRVWRWFADATIYLTMFISLSGIYLWWVLKAERRIGFTLLGLGAVTFFGLIYAVLA